MAKKYDDSKVDLRALKFNKSRGIITQKEYDEFLKSLPDLKGQYQELPVYEEPQDDENGNLTFSAA